MVIVVDMWMLMLHWRMGVNVLVVLGQMEPDAKPHQHAGHQEGNGDRRPQ